MKSKIKKQTKPLTKPAKLSTRGAWGVQEGGPSLQPRVSRCMLPGEPSPLLSGHQATEHLASSLCCPELPHTAQHGRPFFCPISQVREQPDRRTRVRRPRSESAQQHLTQEPRAPRPHRHVAWSHCKAGWPVSAAGHTLSVSAAQPSHSPRAGHSDCSRNTDSTATPSLYPWASNTSSGRPRFSLCEMG